MTVSLSILWLCAWVSSAFELGPIEDSIVQTFSQDDNFLWGASTSAYQVEGAWDRDGRQPSIWDNYSHSPGRETADVADDFYDRYEDDLGLLASYGMNAFRFSFSWSRVFVTTGPNGDRVGNAKGVAFYRNVIGSALKKAVTPLATMYHWDLPLGLSWLNASIVDEFVAYADFLFQTFPEIKLWVTFNEVWSFCSAGSIGIGTEADRYLCGHNVLRAHALVVALWRATYQPVRGGHISIVVNYDFAFPRNSSDLADYEATQLHHDFNLGWIADPVFLTGDYPPSMRQRLGSLLPSFTAEERKLLKGSFSGFYGMNTYSGCYAFADPSSAYGFQSTFVGLDGMDIGMRSDSDWLYVVPKGIRSYLNYVHNRYRPEAVFVTENGVAAPNESSMPLADALHDIFRIRYFASYLEQVADAARDGVPVRGYFAWSLLDNFEWGSYSKRFGLTYVDFTKLVRYPKDSARWFAALLKQMHKKAFPVWVNEHSLLSRFTLPSTQ